MNLNNKLSALYKYESVKKVKNLVRPIKHFLFGKNGIYRAMEELEDPGVIFDVGAATGEYSEHFLRRFPKATIYAFEPLSDSYEKLIKRTSRWGGGALKYSM